MDNQRSASLPESFRSQSVRSICERNSDTVKAVPGAESSGPNSFAKTQAEFHSKPLSSDR